MSRMHTYTFQVNGFTIEAEYSEESVEEIFLPLLRELTERQRKKGGRLVVFMAAPPAVGKSTLAEFLAFLSKNREGLTEVQALGMDGFHYHAEYLRSHEIERDGERILLQNIKGAPETFDTEALKEKLIRMKEEDVRFPLYDRTIHDVRDDEILVTAPIVLIEGNYLLLEEEPWQELRTLADYTIRITAPPELLHRRLVDRKVKGGTARGEAEAFYEKSDRKNVERVLKNAADGDLNLAVTEKREFLIISRRKYA